MFFSDYSEFLEGESEMPDFSAASQQKLYTQNTINYFGQSSLSIHNDAAYTEFSQIIAKRLFQGQYPFNFGNTSPICPLCLNFIGNCDIFMTCHLNQERNYLIHQECLLKNPSYELNNVGEIHQNALKMEKSSLKNEPKFQMGFDSRQFYLELSITHPISDMVYAKLNKKSTLIQNYFNINLKEEEEFGCFPNILCLPLTDFHICLSISQFGNTDNKSKLTKYLNLRNLKIDKTETLKIQLDDNLKMLVDVINDKQEKQRLVNQMNFKYRYSLDLNLPMIRFRSFSVKLPQEFEESSEDEFIMDSNSNIVDDLLNEKTDYDDKSTIKFSDQGINESPRRNISFSDSNSDDGKEQKQTINLEKLIRNKKLIEYVKCNTQSRIFQNFLGEASKDEVNKIIEYVQPHIAELIMHEYGNYMTQKLFNVCSLPQRLKILGLISHQIPTIVKNKQGTHTLQAFIALFTTEEEFAFMAESLKQDFYQICANSNGTHFVQKIVKIFPIQFTLQFFQYSAQNLLAFSVDKNAMCVIKHMMRKLRQLNQIPNTYFQEIEQIRKHFIKYVTFNVDKLILDCYGNYVIQFCYELFDLGRCIGITQRIMSRFTYYAINKFSSSVVYKCVSTYWSDRKIIENLRSCITKCNIVEIYRSKDGNKILLDIMEKYEGTELWNYLSSVLVRTEPTRFYHDRWGICLGTRSGNVGTKFSSFPEGRKKYVNKGKEHY